MYQTTIAYTDGLNATDSNGTHLKIAGNAPVQAGKRVWTDGKIIYGNVLQGGTAFIPTEDYLVYVDHKHNLYRFQGSVPIKIGTAENMIIGGEGLNSYAILKDGVGYVKKGGVVAENEAADGAADGAADKVVAEEYTLCAKMLENGDILSVCIRPEECMTKYHLKPLYSNEPMPEMTSYDRTWFDFGNGGGMWNGTSPGVRKSHEYNLYIKKNDKVTGTIPISVKKEFWDEIDGRMKGMLDSYKAATPADAIGPVRYDGKGYNRSDFDLILFYCQITDESNVTLYESASGLATGDLEYYVFSKRNTASYSSGGITGIQTMIDVNGKTVTEFFDPQEGRQVEIKAGWNKGLVLSAEEGSLRFTEDSIIWKKKVEKKGVTTYVTTNVKSVMWENDGGKVTMYIDGQAVDDDYTGSTDTGWIYYYKGIWVRIDTSVGRILTYDMNGGKIGSKDISSTRYCRTTHYDPSLKAHDTNERNSQPWECVIDGVRVRYDGKTVLELEQGECELPYSCYIHNIQKFRGRYYVVCQNAGGTFAVAVIDRKNNVVFPDALRESMEYTMDWYNAAGPYIYRYENYAFGKLEMYQSAQEYANTHENTLHRYIPATMHMPSVRSAVDLKEESE